MFSKPQPENQVYETLPIRYRPQTLDEMVGQQVSVSKIEGFLMSGKIPRAILISGPFGSGKTTLARLIVRYLNCEHGPKKCCAELDVDPCRSCQLMKGLPNSSDYIELNAADARGINEIRELIEASYLSPQGRYRVFCLDEAHQLTPQASQALLKPLEEPNPRTIWIICTTAPEKIKATIRSRCFPINIGYVKPEACMHFLTAVAKKEEADLPPEVIDRIVMSAHGHPRTALMGLESVLAYITAKGSDNLDDVLQEVLKDVVKGQPEYVAEQFVRLLFNGSPNVLNCSAQVDNIELFLDHVCNLINSVNLAIAGSEQVSKFHKDFAMKTKWKRVFGLKLMPDLARIQRGFVEALREAKNYLVDTKLLLDTATLEALSITRSWPRA